MRITLVQPPYPKKTGRNSATECREWILRRLSALSPGETDVVLLPEYANIAGIEEKDEAVDIARESGKELVSRLSEQAQRLGTHVVAGTAQVVDSHLRNRTVFLGRDGTEKLYHDKTHLTDVESNDWGVVSGTHPTSGIVEQTRYAFAVCFELYFSEYFASLFRLKPDIVLAPSYQRGETAERIRTICQTRAIDTGCFLARSSYAMGGYYGGHSLSVAPDGSILLDMGNTPGIATAEIDVSEKWVKPASFGGSPVEHSTLLETHRKPFLYRTRRETTTKTATAPFPRICAHRGLSNVCPENTLPAFGAALSLGVAEIELDLRLSADGIPVVCHDPNVDRTTNGSGTISELTWKEISSLDAGVALGAEWKGVGIPTFEQIVSLVDGRAVMNINIKTPGENGLLVRKVVDTLNRTGAREYAYIAGDSAVLQAVREIDGDIACACLAFAREPEKQIAEALKYDCRIIQLRRIVTPEQIRAARDAGLVTNLFYSDDPEEAADYVRNGIDTILTNCAHRMHFS